MFKIIDLIAADTSPFLWGDFLSSLSPITVRDPHLPLGRVNVGTPPCDSIGKYGLVIVTASIVMLRVSHVLKDKGSRAVSRTRCTHDAGVTSPHAIEEKFVVKCSWVDVWSDTTPKHYHPEIRRTKAGGASPSSNGWS